MSSVSVFGGGEEDAVLLHVCRRRNFFWEFYPSHFYYYAHVRGALDLYWEVGAQLPVVPEQPRK